MVSVSTSLMGGKEWASRKLFFSSTLKNLRKLIALNTEDLKRIVVSQKEEIEDLFKGLGDCNWNMSFSSI